MTLGYRVPPAARSPRTGISTAVALVGLVLVLAGCATPRPGAPVPTASEATSSSSPSVTPAVSGTPTPDPSSSSASSATPTAKPSVGAVTIITLDVVDGAVEASGIVPEVVESGGRCTLTLTHDGSSVSASTAASDGRESTFCGLVSIDAASLTAGVWSAVLSYHSDSTTAESAPSQVRVP